MRKELREQILVYNAVAAERREKASDLEIMISELGKLPPGQLKKVLTEEVLGILQKYGIVLPV